MNRARPLLLAAAAGGAALVTCACLGTGTRRVDASCREMRASVAREMLRDSREIPILDVRSPATKSLAGAVVIPLPELAGRLGELSRHRSVPVVVVGDVADAGRTACEILSGAGFRYVIFVPEGAEGLFLGVRGAAGSGAVPRGPR